MMKHIPTCADLRKPTGHIVLNSLLLLLIIGSYVPQIWLMVTRRRTSGIAQTYIMFNYLFMATQFALTLLYSSYDRPILGCVADQKLKGLDAYGATLGLVQMTVLWLGSMSLLVVFLLYPKQTHDDKPSNDAASTIPNLTLQERRRHPRVILFICILHTCLWVLPTIIISVPKPWLEQEPFAPHYVYVAFCDLYLLPACLMLVTFIFPLQIREILSSKQPVHSSSLSLTTLALQMLAVTLLAWSWKISAGRPGDPFNTTPPGTTHPWLLYRMGAWLWVNNLIFGIGQALLLLFSLWARSWRSRGGLQITDETTALL